MSVSSIFLLKTKVYYQTNSQSDTLSFQENFPHLFPTHRFSSFHIQKIVCCCCCCLVTKSSPTLCNLIHCSIPGFSVSTISQSLLKFMSIELVVLSNHLILCPPILLCLPSFPASESFPISRLFTSGGQSIEASASSTVLPMNTQS